MIRRFGTPVPVPELCAHTRGAPSACALVLRIVVMHMLLDIETTTKRLYLLRCRLDSLTAWKEWLFEFLGGRHDFSVAYPD
jgi:hypothetical protein